MIILDIYIYAIRSTAISRWPNCSGMCLAPHSALALVRQCHSQCSMVRLVSALCDSPSSSNIVISYIAALGSWPHALGTYHLASTALAETSQVISGFDAQPCL